MERLELNDREDEYNGSPLQVRTVTQQLLHLFQLYNRKNMQLPFGEWLPDQPDNLNPGATVRTNVYHAQSSYKPVKGLVPYSGASMLHKMQKVQVVLEIIQIQYLLLQVKQKIIFIN